MSLGQLWTFLGVALPVLAALLVPMPAVDLTYQLRAGAEILSSRGIPQTDTWTYTVQGATWLDQQWGAQAILAAAYQLGGWTGLAVLRAALVGLAFWFARSTLRAYDCARRPATVLTLLSFIVASPALALRPQLFAIVLFAATMWIVAKRREHPRRLWLIPVIALAWANLHGSYPLVVVLVALGWLDELIRARVARSVPPPKAPVRNIPAPTITPSPRRAAAAQGGTPRAGDPRAGDPRAGTSRGIPGAVTPARAATPERLLGSTGVALIGAISAVVTLVTPFGIDTWRYVVSLAANRAVSARVSEWRPPWPLDPAGLLFYVSVVAVLAVVLLRLRADRFRVQPATVVPFATLLTFGVLGVLTGRGLAWWALAAPVAAARLAHEGALTAALPRFLEPARILFRDTPPGRSTRTNRLNGVVAGVLLVAAVALLPLWRPAGPSGVPLATLSHAPEGIAAELRTLVRTGRVEAGAPTWNPQVWGSWLEWAVPDVSYTVDSRIELFPDVLWDDVDQVATMSGDWLPILDEFEVQVVVLTSEQSALDAALDAAPAWRVAYRDSDGSILIREVPL